MPPDRRQHDAEMVERLARLETTVSHVHEALTEIKDTLANGYRNIDTRVGRLERWRAWTIGALAAIGMTGLGRLFHFLVNGK